MGLGYVASTSDIPSTSKTVFVKPTVPEPPPACMDKGNAIIGGENSAAAEPNAKPGLLPKEALLYAIIVA
jgi:hypothetical protein